MNQWKTVYPRNGNGEWYYLTSLLEMAEVREYVLQNMYRTTIDVITNRGYDDCEMKKWRLTSQSMVRTFVAYLRNGVGLNLKLRMRVKRRKLP